MILNKDELIFEKKNEIFVFSTDINNKIITNDTKLALRKGWNKKIINKKHLQFYALPLINNDHYAYEKKSIDIRNIFKKFFKYVEFATFGNKDRYNFYIGNIWKDHNFFSERDIIEFFILEYFEYGKQIEKLNIPTKLTIKSYFEEYCVHDLNDIDNKENINRSKIFNKILKSSQTGRFINKHKPKKNSKVNNKFNRFNKFDNELKLNTNTRKWNSNLIDILKNT